MEDKLRGNKFVGEKQYEKAAECYTNGILALIDADDSSELLCQLHSNRALCYTNMGMFDEAVVDAKAAVELDPLYPKAHYRLGIALHSGLQTAVDLLADGEGEGGNFTKADVSAALENALTLSQSPADWRAILEILNQHYRKKGGSPTSGKEATTATVSAVTAQVATAADGRVVFDMRETRIPRDHTAFKSSAVASSALSKAAQSKTSELPSLIRSAVMAQGGVPIVMCLNAKELTSSSGSRDVNASAGGGTDNQLAAFLAADLETGLAPPCLQRGGLGPVLLVRQDQRDLVPQDVKSMWRYICFFLESRAAGVPLKLSRTLTLEWERKDRRDHKGEAGRLCLPLLPSCGWRPPATEAV